MKAKLLGIVVALMTVFSSAAIADTPYTLGSTLGITMDTEEFAPLVFLNSSEGCVVYHNNADGGSELVERVENYAFEGEQIVCVALVIDKNGVPEKLEDVYMTVSEDQEPTPDDIEVNCEYTGCPDGEGALEVFNARIGEESIDSCDDIPGSMGVYSCILRVETLTSMHGEYWISVVAEDLDGLLGWQDEQQYWFLNPEIALVVDGSVDFGTVRPGTVSYADTLTVQNAAEDGSGVLLDMYISGTDFYDLANSGAKCPTSNVLALRTDNNQLDPVNEGHNFGYYATNGAYHTAAGCKGEPVADHGSNSERIIEWFDVVVQDEGYFNIPYENGNEDNRWPVIECDGTITLGTVVYQAGNVLSPGAEISLTFALALPEPCNGDFTDGDIFLWAEAI